MLPTYEFLPAPLWLITVLHLLTLTLHFLAMNFLFGGVVILLFGRIRNRWEHPVVQNYLKLLPVAMAATVTLGVAPLLFLQLVYYDQVYSAAIVSGWFWLLVVLVVIVTYYALYGATMGKRGKSALLGLALIGLIYVSFIYSTVFSMAERPDMLRRLYAACQAGLNINDQGGIWALRWAHMVTGAITVGAFFMGVVGRKDPVILGLGKRFFLWGMVGTMTMGLAYLLTLGDFLVPLMRSIGIWALLVSIVLSLGALHLYFKEKFPGAGILVALSMVGMVVARHTLRLIVLEGTFDPGSIPVHPQWGVFALFVLCFVAGVATIGIMLNLFFSNRELPPQSM
jgi:hypothetical protein